MKIHTYTSLLVSLATTLALAACNNPPDSTPPNPAAVGSANAATLDQDRTRPTTAGPPNSRPQDAATRMAARTDVPSANRMDQGNALAMLAAVDEHEIAAAEQARAKHVDGDVRDYAEMLHRDHSKNLSETRALADTAPSPFPELAQLRAKGKAELAELAPLEGDAYEKAYVDAMVKGHADALAMLDNQLIPAASDADVKRHLDATRTAIAHHLQQAKQLQSQ